jgi:hypothetical protein
MYLFIDLLYLIYLPLEPYGLGSFQPALMTRGPGEGHMPRRTGIGRRGRRRHRTNSGSRSPGTPRGRVPALPISTPRSQSKLGLVPHLIQHQDPQEGLAPHLIQHQDLLFIMARFNTKIQKLPTFGIRVSQISTPRSNSRYNATSDPTPRSNSRSTATPRFFVYYYTLQLQDSKVAQMWYPRKSNINTKIQK